MKQIMQNMGYFAPWSRQNSWVDRVAISNIRKANTPQVPIRPHRLDVIFSGHGLTVSLQALAAKAKKIQEENAKFARKFSSPHTSQYTVSVPYVCFTGILIVWV